METCDWYNVACHLGWLQEEIRLFFIWCLEGTLNGVVDIVGAIPVPDWAQNPGSFASLIPSSVAYFGGIFQVGFGAGVCSSAYGLRFILRRIPFIG